MAFRPRQEERISNRLEELQTIGAYFRCISEYASYALLSTSKLLMEESRNSDNYETIFGIFDILSGTLSQINVLHGLLWRHFDTPEYYASAEFKEYDLFKGLHDLSDRFEKLRKSYDSVPVIFLFAKVSQEWPFPPIIRLNEVVSDFKYLISDIIFFFQEKEDFDISKIDQKVREISKSGQLTGSNFLSRLLSKKEEGSLTDSVADIPVHPGKLIENYLIEHKWSVPHAASQLGVTREHVYSIMKGSTAISTSMARALERARIGGTALDWLIRQAKYDLAQPERPPAPRRRLARAARI